MQKWVIKKCMNLIKKYNPNHNENTLAEIEYGLISIYLLITKAFIIILISILLGITKEMLIFLFIYNIIKAPSFGLHATKSWVCLLSSSIVFLGIPFLCNTLNIIPTTKAIIGIITILLIAKNCPADTSKRPIVNKKRRLVYKSLSILIAIIFSVIALVIDNNFLSNCFIFALIIQTIVTAPMTYKFLKLPYHNYKKYILENI